MRKSSMSRGRIHILRRSQLLQPSQALKFRRVDDGDTTRVQLDVAQYSIIKHLGFIIWWWRRLRPGALAGGRGHGIAATALGCGEARGWCASTRAARRVRLADAKLGLLQQGSSAAAQRWRAFVQGWANVQGHCCEHAVRRLSACTLPYDNA